MKKAIFTLTFLISFIYVKSQTNIFIEDNIRTGSMVNNYQNYDPYPKTNPLMLNEIKIGHKTLGKKNWHEVYNYPEVAISFFEGNTGNKKQFGYIFGIMPNINFDLIKLKNSNLQLTFGWGLSYITKPFDSILNPYNILIGSKINHLALISLTYKYNITETFSLQFGGTYIHASNGHYQVPNGGMNYGSISLGAKKYFSNHQINPKTHVVFDKKTNINLSLGIGTHEFAGSTKPAGTPKYNIYTASIFLAKDYNNWGKFQIGLAGKYYEAFNYYIKKQNLYYKNVTINSSIFTIFIGNEFKFGHFGIFTIGGINIYYPFIKDFVYKNTIHYNINNILELYISSKLGMKYYILNPETSKFNIFIAAAIKANFGNADFTEISSGIVF